jgi:hypothetical protein
MLSQKQILIFKKREILVSIPVADLTFKEEDKLPKASVEFEFYIYKNI